MVAHGPGAHARPALERPSCEQRAGLALERVPDLESWLEPDRTRFTNLLFMHVRSFSYEWDWKRFSLRYMVFDGCYEMARRLGLVKKVPHAKRFQALFTKFGMPLAASITLPPWATLTDQLVHLRNELFHVALWDGGQPGGGSRTGWGLADHLWRINDRLLFALAGYSGDYLKIPWWNIGLTLI